MDAIQTLAHDAPEVVAFGVDLVIRATLIIAIVQFATIAMRRRSASSRHFVLSLGMVALVALPILMFTLPETRLEILPSAARATNASVAAAQLPADLAWKAGAEPSSPSGGSVEDAVAATRQLSDVPALRAVSGLAWFGANWLSISILALAAIPLLLLGRLAFGIAALGAIARRSEQVTSSSMLRSLERARDRLGVTRPTALLVSDEVSVPVVWGVANSTLILPVDALEWSNERLRVVLMHEMAHVRRADVVSLFVGRIATALYWFHPFSWIVERDARRECERACDDLVLEHGARPSEYAHHLLGIASGEDLAEGYASVSLAMARPSELEGRLVAILRASSARKPVSRRFAWVAALTLGAALLPIATVRLGAKPVASAPGATTAQTRSEVAKRVETHTETERQTKMSSAELVSSFADSIVDLVDDGVEGAIIELTGNKHGKRKQAGSEGERWYDRGMELHRADRYDEARAAFEKAIAHDFKRGASAYNIACGFGLRGDAGNALRWLEDAVAAGFDDVEHLEEDTDLDPIRSDPQFRGLIRDLRASQGYRGEGRDRIAEARQRVGELRRERSEEAGEWAGAAVDLLRLRDVDASIDAFEEAIRIEPEASTPRYNLACALAIKGERRAALDALEGAILAGFEGRTKLENDPDLTSLRSDSRFAGILKMNDQLAFWSGETKWKGTDKRELFRASMPRYEEAVRLYPQAGRAWFNLGFGALSVRDTAKARDAFGKALSLGFRRGTTMYNLACVEAVAGNKNAAFAWLAKAEEIGFHLSNIANDDDLESIEDDPRFDELLERAWQRDSQRDEKRMKIRQTRASASSTGSWGAV